MATNISALGTEMSFNWTCPHCDRDQAVTKTHYSTPSDRFEVSGHIHSNCGYEFMVIACANPQCLEIEVVLAIGPGTYPHGSFKVAKDKMLFYGPLIPTSRSRPQPEYIPESLRADYREACAIRDLSPKASATLSRRCIQGMIRDFCGIAGRTLDWEIKELGKRVQDGTAPREVLPDTIEAIDHIRKIGNIGAHMEQDINVIVDVDPDEAQLLIELIEMLFKEWYVAREDRKNRLAQLKATAAAKAVAQGKLPAPMQVAAPQLPSPGSRP